MFLLFGFRTVLHELPGRMATCQYCGQFVRHQLQERATKLTLFFISVFTTSKTFEITCTNCGQHSTIKSGQKNALLS